MRVFLIQTVFLLAAIPCSAATITVDDDAPADFNNIQPALDAAKTGDVVLVADGVYKGASNRNLNFKGKAITLKSSNGPSGCIIDAEGQGRVFYFANNESQASVVDGFTITGGYTSSGAGIYLNHASPKIVRCVIRGNHATYGGGGIDCENAAAPLVQDCRITDNLADSYGGGVYCYYSSPVISRCSIIANESKYSGGGVYCSYGSSCTITDSIVEGNVAKYDAGGVYGGSQASVILSNCAFVANSAGDEGGAVSCYYGTATITNCTFVYNEAGYQGGALCNSSATSVITNCTFRGNDAPNYCGGIHCRYDPMPLITNCIFADNTAHAISRYYSTAYPAVAYCLFYNNPNGDYFDYDTDLTYTGATQINTIQGANNNITDDPAFAFPTDCHLLSNSGAIDRGTNEPQGGLSTTDMDGNPRSLLGRPTGQPRADVGAYEYNPLSPSIAVSQTAVEFVREQGAANPDSQLLQLRNCGGGVLNWHIESDSPWLQVLPNTGSCTAQTSQVSVSVSTDGLPRGIYVGALSIIDPNAVNSPRQVWITLRVKGRLYVPGQYPSIRQAVASAMDGETIEVAAGKYKELIELDKQIELLGVGQPVIDANGLGGGNVVSLTAHSCIVNGFRITAGATGIQVSSSGNIISNNVIVANEQGIVLSSGSGSNTLNNNQIADNPQKGLYISYSAGNILRDNHISGSMVNFHIEASTLQQYTQNIDTSNTVDGKNIYYLVEYDDMVIDPTSNAGCVVVVDCTDIIIEDIVVSHNATGILLAYSKSCVVDGVKATDNSYAGIMLDNSTNIRLENNAASGSNFGVLLSTSAGNALRRNACTNNSYSFVCRGAAKDFVQDIDTTNTLNGKPLYYLLNKTGTVVASDANAAAVFAVNCTNITVRDMTFSGNGTGVAFVGTSDSVITNVTAVGNCDAGVLLLDSSRTTLVGNRIENNPVGIRLTNCGYCSLQNSIIARNNLGITCTSANINVANSIVRQNLSQGGIYIEFGSVLNVANSTIINNARGTDYYIYYPDGGGITCDYSSTAQITNSIIWGNRPAQIADATRFKVNYTDIQGGLANVSGTGIIDMPPLLTADGHLMLGSPCVDAGDPMPRYVGYDIDGEPRQFGRRVDLGADEFADADEDQLPDWFEKRYFDPAGRAAKPADDPDGDGYSNLAEYQWYASDPTTPCTSYYVDANQPDDKGDGQSWQTAKKTVQAAINAAQDGDRVILAPGLYSGPVNLGGRQIVLQGMDPSDGVVMASTIILGTVSFTQGEQQGCTLWGLTVSNRSGTGILCQTSGPTIRNCLITDNWSSTYQQAGGITCQNAEPVITHCIITGNVSSDYGAGIYCQNSRCTVTNCVLTGNLCRYSSGYGTAVYLQDSDMCMRQCTIADNEYPEGYSTSGMAIYCDNSRLQIHNSILWNNFSTQIASMGNSQVILTYSDIGGGPSGGETSWVGLANLCVDPCFVQPGYWTRPPSYSNARWIGGDYHLRSAGWRWVPRVSHGTNWIWDDQTSLCIDTGNPATPLGDEVSVAPSDPDGQWGRNLRIDMGAYGGTAQAGIPPVGFCLLGDLTNDGQIDFVDVARWFEPLQSVGTEDPGDLDKNGIVNLSDLALLVQDWLARTDWYGLIVPLERWSGLPSQQVPGSVPQPPPVR